MGHGGAHRYDARVEPPDTLACVGCGAPVGLHDVVYPDCDVTASSQARPRAQGGHEYEVDLSCGEVFYLRERYLVPPHDRQFGEKELAAELVGAALAALVASGLVELAWQDRRFLFWNTEAPALRRRKRGPLPPGRLERTLFELIDEGGAFVGSVVLKLLEHDRGNPWGYVLAEFVVKGLLEEGVLVEVEHRDARWTALGGLIRIVTGRRRLDLAPGVIGTLRAQLAEADAVLRRRPRLPTQVQDAVARTLASREASD